MEPFLTNLFQDGEIIPLGPFQVTPPVHTPGTSQPPRLLQQRLGAYIAKRRSPNIREQYAQIGGGSPIGHWTAVQVSGGVLLLAAD